MKWGKSSRVSVSGVFEGGYKGKEGKEGGEKKRKERRKEETRKKEEEQSLKVEQGETR